MNHLIFTSKQTIHAGSCLAIHPVSILPSRMSKHSAFSDPYLKTNGSTTHDIGGSTISMPCACRGTLMRRKAGIQTASFTWYWRVRPKGRYMVGKLVAGMVATRRKVYSTGRIIPMHCLLHYRSCYLFKTTQCTSLTVFESCFDFGCVVLRTTTTGPTSGMASTLYTSDMMAYQRAFGEGIVRPLAKDFILRSRRMNYEGWCKMTIGKASSRSPKRVVALLFYLLLIAL